MADPCSRKRPNPTARISLPIYRAGGEHEPVFTALQRKEASLAAEVAALDLQELRRHRLLSANAKTSVSLDFPIGATCDPTPLCARYCYGSSPHAATTWRKSLRKRLRNLRYFTLESPDAAAARLAHEFERARRRWAPRARLDYLRVNGTGDLFPAIVPVLNIFAERNPGVRLWIVTRRFDLAAGIAALPNVYLQLSLDATTPPALERMARRLVETHPRAYFSFLRTRPQDDTRGAAIVFNEKRTAGLPYRGRTDCPVDAGRLPLANVRGVGGTACSRCRKCFSDATVGRQRSTQRDEP
jgi:hypothetical protein